MADFTTVLSDAAVMDASQVALYDQGVIVAAQEELIMDQFATIKTEIKAKSIQFTKYDALSLATTALTDGEDVTSEAMADAPITLTPVEYGNVVTTTQLANLQSGGKVDAGAIRLVGINMGQTQDKLAILTLEGATNELTPGGTAEASLTASNIITTALMEKAYNKLRRAKIPKATNGGGLYVSIMHPDIASDLRNVAAAGDWVDVSKYSNAVQVYKNEIGTFKGFRIVENANITVNADAGDAAVDTYHTLCFGFNAFGKAVSLEPSMRLTGPFDKLARILNFGWYGVLKYGIVDSDAIWKITTASSFGANS